MFPTKIKYLVNGIIVSCPKDRRGLTKALHAAKTIQVKAILITSRGRSRF